MLKTMKRTMAVLPIVAIGVLLFMDRSGADLVRPEYHYKRLARLFASGLPQVHLTHQPLNNSVAEKALKNYLRFLDHDRTYFMQGDVDDFYTKVDQLDDDLRRGDLTWAFAIFEVFKQRAENRVEYANRLLKEDEPFDLERDETYTWKRKELPWASTQEEWDELWRRKIKNEYLGHIVSKTLKKEEAEKNEAEGIEPDEDDEDVRKLNMTPQERITKSYNQFLKILQEHDAEWVLQAYLSSFSGAYDTHSSYMSPRTDEDFDIQMSLSLTGIGALLSLDEGAARIERLIPGGPAERDGRLKPGDKIVAVSQDGEESVDILYWPLYKSVRLIRGPIGTRVTITIIPKSDPTGSTLKDITLTRDKIKLEERAASYESREVEDKRPDGPSHKLGVITLPDFYADLRGHEEERRSCSADVKKLLEQMKEEGVEGLLLDLRNNGGGSLLDAITMTGFFIEEGPVVQVKAVGATRVHRDPDRDILYDGPMVILVNRMSASASEILAGALQDYRRAVVVGDTKTHGKGSVQSVFAVDQRNPKLGSMKITTAGFYRIDGRSTQLHGVEPDIVLPSALETMEIGEEFLPNVLTLSGIRPANYVEYPLTGDLIQALDERSLERRTQDERFSAFKDLLGVLKEKNERTFVSLNLEERLQTARADQELNEKLEAFTPSDDDDDAEKGEGEEDAKEKAPDLVLDEALHILRDLVELQETPHLTNKSLPPDGGV